MALAAGLSLLAPVAVAAPASAAPQPAEITSSATTSAVGVGEVLHVRNCDGRWEEFILSYDAALWHRYQVTPGETWSSWSSLGGSLIYGITGAINTNCSVEIFGIGGGNSMYHIWQQPSAPGGWSGWGGLGGYLVSAPDAYYLSDGRIEVCAWGPDNIYHCKAQTAPSSGPWTGWY